MNYTTAGELADRLVETFRDPDDHETRDIEIFVPFPNRVEVAVRFYGTIFSRELIIAHGVCADAERNLDYRIETKDANTQYLVFYELAGAGTGAGDVYDIFAIDGEGDYYRQDADAVEKRRLFFEAKAQGMFHEPEARS